jgi:hypothetical protein
MAVWHRIKDYLGDLDLSYFAWFLLSRTFNGVRSGITAVRWLRHAGMLGLASLGIAVVISARLKADQGLSIRPGERLLMLAVFGLLIIGNALSFARNRVDLGLLRNRT